MFIINNTQQNTLGLWIEQLSMQYTNKESLFSYIISKVVKKTFIHECVFVIK